MIKFDKKISIDSSFPLKNEDLFLSLSNLYLNCDNTKKLSNLIKVKNKEIIHLDIFIENISKCIIENLKLIINDDSIFEFIPCSLSNKITKECYASTYNNLFNLGSIKSNESLLLQLYIKVNLENLDFSNFNNPIEIFSLNSSTLETISSALNVLPIQAELNINISSYKNNIELQNTGSCAAKNLIYKYEIPNGFDIDINCIQYTFQNISTNVSVIKLNNNLLFKISSLPETTNLISKKLIIKIPNKNATYLTNTSCTIK